LAHHNNWSRWFVISSLPPICCSGFSCIGGVAKEYITKLGCKKLFSQSHILSTTGDALSRLRSVGQKQDHLTVIRAILKIHNFGSQKIKDLFLIYNLGSPIKIKIKRINSLARKLLVLYWFFHENCRFFKGLEITRTNGC
jgi:hypothetical protein